LSGGQEELAVNEIAGRTDLSGVAGAVVHESYSFACMRCGHGWEQSYEIEHHIDADGTEFVMYVADGEIVPSPLSRPTCLRCGGHLVRIMAAGRVSSVQSHLRRTAHTSRTGAPRQRPAKTEERPEQNEQRPEQTEQRPEQTEQRPEQTEQRPEQSEQNEQSEQDQQHHWHLSDLLHPFHRSAG
jgi:hypothetical protein